MPFVGDMDQHPRQKLQRVGGLGTRRRALGGDPDGGVHVEPRVRPGEHAGGLLLIKHLEAHEELEHRAAKRLGQPRGIVHRPRHEGAICPKAAVGDEQVQIRQCMVAIPECDDSASTML